MNVLLVPLALKLAYATAAFTLAACALWLVLRLARVRSPAVHRWAWAIVLLQGIVFWRLPVEIPWPQAEPSLGSIANSLAPNGWPAAPGAGDIDRNQQQIDLATPPPVPESFAKDTRPVTSTVVSGFVLAIWFGGMLAALGRSCLAYLRFWRSLPPAEPVAAEWRAELVELSRELKISRPISLQGTEQLGPALCWLPSGYRLLIPSDTWRVLSATQRQAILRHELGHYQRGDLWKSLAMRLVALPQWFNPLAWVALRLFDEAAEWACDDAVQEGTPDATFEYLRALIQLGGPPQPHASLQAAIAGGSIPYRVRRLLSSPGKDSMMKTLAIFTLTLAVAAAGLTQLQLAVAQAPAEKGTPEASPEDATREVQASDTSAALTAANQSTPAPVDREATIDMSRVFKAEPGFLASQHALRDKQSSFESEIKRQQTKLAALLEKQRTTNDEQLAKLLESELASDQLEMQKRIAAKRREFLNEEALAYHEAFERIRAEVARYAQEHGIRQVRRTQSVVRDDEPIDLQDRQALLARLNRDIIYIAPQQIDITKAVIERLNGTPREKF
jgi:beta-lactamase regulating signal transducer with metallopeptidase domain/Skp family chaperone for outer membrane proteins